MPARFKAVIAFGAGLVAAAAAALDLPPLLAFGLVSIFAALGLAMLRPAPGPAAASPAAARDPNAPAFARALVETLPTPLLVLGPTGRIAYANPAAHAALPRLQASAHVASVLRAPAFVEAVSATLADGIERHVAFAANPGRERFLDARVALLPPGGPFGAEALAMVQIEDRTDARRAEAQRSDFIANASHELRTPLAAIIGYIETLAHHARDDPEARERFLGIMAREAARMRRLVDDLMSLSRIEMAEHLAPAETWPLAPIAGDAAAALAPVAERAGVTLAIETGDAGGSVVCDRDQLAQVFANLVDNAIRYGGPGTSVRVRALAPDGAHPRQLGVAVEDDGPGVEREHLPRLTERFYRVSAASSRNKGGTGLGLAIVKHILNRHHGRLEIASVPGKGSSFTVWLPEAETAAPEPMRSPDAAHRPHA